MKRPFVLGAAVLAVAVVAGNSTLIPARSVEDAKPSDGRRSDRFEVWIADQSDTRPGFGGQLLIFDGEDLMGRRPGKAAPAVRLDLGADTADLCRAETGRNPVRPHMILFNQEHTHAVLSFVASGHVLIMEAAATNIDAMGVERADVHALTIRVPPRKRHGRH